MCKQLYCLCIRCVPTCHSHTRTCRKQGSRLGAQEQETNQQQQTANAAAAVHTWNRIQRPAEAAMLQSGCCATSKPWFGTQPCCASCTCIGAFAKPPLHMCVAASQESLLLPRYQRCCHILQHSHESNTMLQHPCGAHTPAVTADSAGYVEGLHSAFLRASHRTPHSTTAPSVHISKQARCCDNST